MIQIFVGVIPVLLILQSTSVEGACDLLEELPYGLELPSNHPPTIPFWEGRAYGVAFAEFEAHRKSANPFSVRLSGTGDNQTLALFVKENFSSFVDEWRYYYVGASLWLRCADGVRVIEKYIEVRPLDITPIAPYFSSLSYIYSVSLPWPESIPITHEWPIWARDKDYNPNMTEVTFSVDMPNVVTIRTTNYSDYPEEAADFKADLFLNSQQLVPGTYEMVLTADDGYIPARVPVTIIIGEATCKTPAQNPSFGKLGAPVNFYKGIVSSPPSPGDLIGLNGQKVIAYHPDPLCLIDLSVESDFLEINTNSEIVFSRSLSSLELESLGSPYITQIVAADKITGTSHKVPLIICIELSDGAQRPAILQSN